MKTQIYVMATFFANQTKVGITSRPLARIRAIRNGNPNDIDFAFLSKPMPRVVARAVEAAVHQELAALRMNGEWFAVCPFAAIDVAKRAIARVQQ